MIKKFDYTPEEIELVLNFLSRIHDDPDAIDRIFVAGREESGWQHKNNAINAIVSVFRGITLIQSEMGY